MSRNNVLSPVKILDSKVLGVEFKTINEETEKSGPEDLLATKYGRGRSFIENECLRCEVILEAALDRVRKKSNVPIHFVASAKVGVTIAIPLEAIGDLSEGKMPRVCPSQRDFDSIWQDQKHYREHYCRKPCRKADYSANRSLYVARKR